MLTVLQAVILGIIQGVTEWLPVSSSGHLVIVQNYFNLKVPVLFDVILHLGTLIVIFLVFHKDIFAVLKALLKADFQSEDGQLALFIVIGSIPTAIIGYIFHDVFVSFFSNMMAVAIALLFTGSVLFLTRRTAGKKPLGVKHSVLMGIAQGIAIIPGVSRSGLTISTGLLAGVEKSKTLRFSFLLSIPAVIGAAVFELRDIALLSSDYLAVIIGFIISVLVGYLSLKFLIRTVLKGKLHVFSYYCWILGVILLFLQVIKI